MIAFWILAPIMVVAALGILFVRKAVHAAHAARRRDDLPGGAVPVLEAPFLFAVQIIVYTGAILMLFLFVLMLVGVDASDSVVETIRGQRLLAMLAGLLLGLVLVVGLGQITLGTAVGLDDANAGGNIQALADILFSRYVFAFETTSALLITAAVGAMVLAHRERLTPKAQPGRDSPPSGSRTTPRRARTSARCLPPGSTPGTTRSTPRPCCPTARRPSRRSRGCSRPAARCARRPPSPTPSTRSRSSIDGTAAGGSGTPPRRRRPTEDSARDRR